MLSSPSPRALPCGACRRIHVLPLLHIHRSLFSLQPSERALSSSSLSLASDFQPWLSPPSVATRGGSSTKDTGTGGGTKGPRAAASLAACASSCAARFFSSSAQRLPPGSQTLILHPTPGICLWCGTEGSLTTAPLRTGTCPRDRTWSRRS